MIYFLPKIINMRTKTTLCISLSVSFVIVLSTIVTSCNKTPVVPIAVLNIDSSKTVTAYDPTTNFSNYKTIALTDSVSVANGFSVSKELSKTDSAYLVALASGIAGKGFTIVSKTAHPDLVLNITRIASTTDGLVDNSSYWSNYGMLYNPTVFGENGVSYSINFTTSQSVEDGVLSFELLDIKNASANNQINIIWNGMISGYSLLSDISSVSIETGILFKKSPYLKAK